VVTTNLGGFDQAHAVVIQPDGTVLSIGVAETTGKEKSNGFALARYTAAGALDSSFGAKGTVRLNPAASSSQPFRSSWANAAVRQPDGRIVAAGVIGERQAGLARFNADGSLDSTFGTPQGFVNFTAGTTYTEALAIALQPDGRILTTGHAHWMLFLARHTTDGKADTSFGTSGVVTVDLGKSGPADGAHLVGSAVLVQPDGRIVVVGTAYTVDATQNLVGSDVFAARFTRTGAPDPSFGNSGIALVDLGGQDAGHAALLTGAGQIVIAGTRSGDLALVRLTATGVLDSTFGTKGVTIRDAGQQDTLTGLAALPDGSLAAVGMTGNATLVDPTYSKRAFFGLDPAFVGKGLVAHYAAAGKLDPAFGVDGLLAVAGVNHFMAVAPVDANRVVAAGGSTQQDFALGRYVLPPP